jgi:hypothetical protein
VNRTSIIAATAVVATLVTGVPAYAADTAKPLDQLKQAVVTRIDKRLDALKKFGGTLTGAERVTAAHRATLTTLLKSQTDGLTALRTKVGTETTAAAVKADAKSMVDDYRVFVLTGPKVRLTAAIDTELAAVAKLHDKKKVDDAKLNAVSAGLTGKVDTLLGFKPGPDTDAIRTEVKAIRGDAKDARTALKDLRKTK